MTLHVNDLGTWKEVNGLYVKDAGAWKEAIEGWVKDAGVWKQFYQGEVVVVITTNQTNLNIQSLFTAAVWAGAMWKRVVIMRGVSIYSTTPATPAMRTGTGRGGKLVIENDGYILGAGGNANSGVGGTALLVEQTGVRLTNTFGIYGGGGGGGPGGNGGPGWYQLPRTVTEGEYYDTTSNNQTLVLTIVPTYAEFNWHYGQAGGWRATFGDSNYNGYARGDGWIYYRGTYVYTEGPRNRYYLYRQTTVYDTNYSTGGAGGAGGRGTGNNGENTTGLNGAAGGINAGAGGKGGNGGAWGAQGATGATGASGNNGGGSTGAVGGLGGFYISGNANLEIFNNSGTVLGRFA